MVEPLRDRRVDRQGVRSIGGIGFSSERLCGAGFLAALTFCVCAGLVGSCERRIGLGFVLLLDFLLLGICELVGNLLDVNHVCVYNIQTTLIFKNKHSGQSQGPDIKHLKNTSICRVMDDLSESDGGRATVVDVKPKKLSVVARQQRHLDRFKDRLHELGWRRRFIDSHVEDYVGLDLDENRQETILDEHVKDWVRRAFTGVDDDISDVDLLYAAGLSKHMVRKATEVIVPLYDTCYSRIQLLEIAVEYVALDLYTKVLKPNQHYLIQTPLKDIWTPNATFKYVYNMSDPVLNQVVSDNGLLATYPQMQGGAADFFFHATNIRSALNIADDGIAHLEGRRCLDFGITPSFYTTPDLSSAVEWCGKKTKLWKGDRCILVFIVPLESVKALKSKVFQNDTIEWGDLVTSSRRFQKRYNALDKFDLVSGPMAANVKEIEEDNIRACPHTPPKFQLASKSINSDIYLRSCLAGAIFMVTCASKINVFAM